MRWKSLVVGNRLLRLLVAIQANKTNSCSRYKFQYSLEHADPGAQNWYHDEVCIDLVTGRLGNRRLHRNFFGLYVFQCFVANELCDFRRQLPKALMTRINVADDCEFVLHTRVIN